MRILLCGVAAVALSGCSWMGFGHGQKHGQASQSYGSDQGYSQSTSSNSGYSSQGATSYGYDGNVVSDYGHTASDAAYGSSYGSSSYATTPSYASTSNDNCCVGGKMLSRWNVEGGIGQDYVVGGTAITGNKTHPGNIGPVSGVRKVSSAAAFDDAMRYELGGSYALNPNRKLSLTAHYAEADGNNVAWGNHGNNTLRGTMSEYKSYGLEAGLRQYMMPANIPVLNSVRPYVEGKVGAAHLDAMRLENITQSGPDAFDPRTPTSLNFYQSGWVPTAAALIGMETPVFNRFTMGVETGIRYAGAPEADGTHLNAPAPDFNRRYSGANKGGERWSVPVTIRGRYRF